uniref:AAA family ATPase n=1 Tax=uncultured Thiotrichaceae bacterium TaxID=298394 RepID=A0A6S6UG89_9GAMM|nr:MAG: AAA family ATPase [uncultured Thiotrichaceae bacterium]
MKIPYGVSNFRKIREQGFTYIDKTAYIAALEEQGSYLFLLRPRRFGKSLFISTLECYYGQEYAADFEPLFGDLYIGQNPTPLKNSYQVLFMEFSGIDTHHGEADIYQRFTDKVETSLHDFLSRYGYPEATLTGVSQRQSPESKMEYFFSAVSGQKILFLIDEYDHFANAILAEDMQLFQQIVGKGGFVRSFYETLKAATQRGTLDRLFVTGVTPLMLDSLTSGFNIGENLSLKAEFNEIMGFTRDEVQTLLHPIVQQCGLDDDKLMRDMAAWYNGYRFNNDAKNTLYNANMVLYFIKNFQGDKCAYPKRMLDENVASDYGKLMGLFSIGNRDTNFAVLDELINQGTVRATQRRKFDFDKGFDQDDFISLLAYMGFISLSDETLAGEIFSIPNYVIHELYFQYFKIELERRNQITIASRNLLLAIEALALRDDIQPLTDELQQVLQLLSNRDSLWLNEQHIKSILLTLLYQSQVYFIQSEREMNRKYPDVMLLERSPYVVEHQHLIELKYSKKGDKEAGWQAKKQEGIEQVKGYLALPTIAELPKLSAWLLITDGERLEVVRQ